MQKVNSSAAIYRKLPQTAAEFLTDISLGPAGPVSSEANALSGKGRTIAGRANERRLPLSGGAVPDSSPGFGTPPSITPTRESPKPIPARQRIAMIRTMIARSLFKATPHSKLIAIPEKSRMETGADGHIPGMFPQMPVLDEEKQPGVWIPAVSKDS